ncbi:MAG UNVERIFIED_CONTAM: hypothetical protein LVR29_26200 [Microcystis novacekii LVE1205-3]
MARKGPLLTSAPLAALLGLTVARVKRELGKEGILTKMSTLPPIEISYLMRENRVGAMIALGPGSSLVYL